MKKQTVRTQTSFALAVMFGLLVFATNANAEVANESTNPRDWVNYGDNLRQSGSAKEAVGYYARAYALATEAHDPYAMADLAVRFLQLGEELPTMNSYRRAREYAVDLMKQDPNGGQSYTNGLNVLKSIIDLYKNTLRTLPASPSTQEELKSQANKAAAVVMLSGWASTEPPSPPTPGSAPPSTPSSPGDPNWDDINRVPRNPR